ncbi:PID-CTERM protein-sorting domain-containing protein [uncultured Cytophaga sp.]|uniref:PID-CTERM protein-sorting domain-containing protein n=1 Tax=uncultured Cytophaga sp. TaxID=160238 RepID=UPI002613B7EC|nr:hypothetical protein [uncultured Cytophaga sp.]
MKVQKIVFAFVLFISLLSVSFADCGTLKPCTGDDGDIPGNNCCDDVNVPFDGGVSFLIAAGLSAGGYSIFKKKKKAE